MARIAIVYWTATGNTETIADLLKEDLEKDGLEVELAHVTDFDPSTAAGFDGFAFGCPAQGREHLETMDFEPLFFELAPQLGDKPVLLFGSYDWGGGQWIRTWRERAEAEGVRVIDVLPIRGYPYVSTEPQVEAAARELCEAAAR